MGTLMQMTCSSKLKMQLIFLNQGQMGLQLAFFYLIMPPATRDEHLMLIQHRKCQKDPMPPGATTKMATDNTPQDFYFADNHPTMPGWFKGMEIMIHEHGLWPQKGFKCVAGKTDCYCCWLYSHSLILRTKVSPGGIHHFSGSHL